LIARSQLSNQQPRPASTLRKSTRSVLFCSISRLRKLPVSVHLHLGAPTKVILMKQIQTPTCPRCNSSGEVKRITLAPAPPERSREINSDGYVLGGLCIRPDSPDWYCAGCDESFGAWREFWGDPLTDLIQ
jgi:hypothetical protein